MLDDNVRPGLTRVGQAEIAPAWNRPDHGAKDLGPPLRIGRNGPRHDHDRRSNDFLDRLYLYRTLAVGQHFVEPPCGLGREAPQDIVEEGEWVDVVVLAGAGQGGPFDGYNPTMPAPW